MSNTTTNSDSKQLPATIQIKEKALVVCKKETSRWLKHYGNDMANRIPMSLINVQQGLQDPQLHYLKKNTSVAELVTVLSFQIKNLADFLNLSKTFTAVQIADTAELIIEEFDDFSFTALADCIKCIKAARPPFNDKFYEHLDGRKFIEMLHRYRDYQIDEREKLNRQIKPVPQDNPDHKVDPNISEKLRKLNEDLLRSFTQQKIKGEKGKPSPERSAADKLTHSWINEFWEMSRKRQAKTGQEPYPGELDDYLAKKMEEYNNDH